MMPDFGISSSHSTTGLILEPALGAVVILQFHKRYISCISGGKYVSSRIRRCGEN